jgi:hypothetical protein
MASGNMKEMQMFGKMYLLITQKKNSKTTSPTSKVTKRMNIGVAMV